MDIVLVFIVALIVILLFIDRQGKKGAEILGSIIQKTYSYNKNIKSVASRDILMLVNLLVAKTRKELLILYKRINKETNDPRLTKKIIAIFLISSITDELLTKHEDFRLFMKDLHDASNLNDLYSNYFELLTLSQYAIEFFALFETEDESTLTLLLELPEVLNFVNHSNKIYTEIERLESCSNE